MKTFYFILLVSLLFIACDNKTSNKITKPKTTICTIVQDTIIQDSVKPQKLPIEKKDVVKVIKKDTAVILNKKKTSSKTHVVKKGHYKFRKYKHVRDFYAKLAPKTTKICMDENIPPAALLAIAGLESGWNRGYIGKITGNILSLGASKKRGDIRLPPLRLPRVIKTKELLFNEADIAKYKPSELRYENRPASLKKDYRPSPYAGTTKNLGYLENHPEAKAAAQAQNIKDFVTTFISRKSRISAYRNTRARMDALVAKHGKAILLEEKTAIAFVYGIGGKKNSYNYRETWPKKVVSIMKAVGLVPLTKDLYEGKTFEESFK